jgi:aldehyde:ferredoxin oxidoreductase
MKDAGTVSVSDYANAVGALPTKYFQELSYDKVDDIGSAAVIEHKYKRGTCSQCAFACKLPTRDGESGLETEGPEYETVMAFGSNAGVDDVVDVMQSNELCDQYGLDTISCGDVVAAYLAANDEFGNVELIHELVEKIAHREGVGDTLAEGVDRCHEELGVENWSVKGMEFAAHDGRTLNGQGLSFATSNRGADHMYAEMYQLEYPLVAPDKALDSDGVAGKSGRLIEMENKNAVHDSGVLCKFSYSNMTHERYARLFDTDWETLMDVGGRVIELERHFNNRRGFDRSDDADLPYELEGLDEELSNYYDLRGGTTTAPCRTAPSAAVTLRRPTTDAPRAGGPTLSSRDLYTVTGPSTA